MDAVFRLSNDIIDNDKVKLKKELRALGFEEDMIERLKNDDNWSTYIDKKALKKISVALDGIDNALKIELVEHEDVDFEYCDSLKKLFLQYLSEVWVSDTTLHAAVSALQVIEEKEILFNKCVIEFSDTEIKASLATLLGDMKYHRLRNRINVISKLQFFYDGLVPMGANWADFKGQKVISEILGQEFQEHVLTKRDLIDLCSHMSNVQESVIPILIFEGVRVSKVDDTDELRYLKKSDFLGNRLVIRGNGKKEPREITLDSDVSDIIKQAIEQEYMLRMVKHEPSIVPLEETDYIIRKTTSSRKRIDTSYDDEVMSFRGVYSRFNACRNQMEALLYDIPFSPQSIATCGKVYYVNRYIAEGMDIIEAIRKTVVRFGVWYGDPEEDKQDAKNIQLVNRLKKVWSAYAK